MATDRFAQQNAILKTVMRYMELHEDASSPIRPDPIFDAGRVLPLINSDKDRAGLEIEIRFGRFVEGNFESDIPFAKFAALKRALLDRTDLDVDTVTDTVEINRNVRKIISSSGAVLMQTKDKVAHYDVLDLGLRIASAVEKDIQYMEDFRATYTRTRKRWVFTPTDENSVLAGWVVMMSDVKDSKNKHTFEIEVEKDESRQFENMNAITRMIVVLLEAMQGGTRIITTTEAADLARETRVLLGLRRVGPKLAKPVGFKEHSGGIISSWWPKPMNIKTADLFEMSGRYGMVKYDGERKFLFLTATGTYLMYPPYDISYFGPPIALLDSTILDGEYLNGVFYAFDCPVYKNVDQRSYYFSGRRRAVTEVVKLVNSIEGGLPNVKEVKAIEIAADDVYGSIAKVVDEEKLLHMQGLPTDGYIFAPVGEYSPLSRSPGKEVRSSIPLKWKPSSKMTIDFVVSDDRKLMVSDGGDKLSQFPRDVGVRDVSDDEIGQVLEMKLENGYFIPVRSRPDRDKPNYKDVALSVWEDIKHPITIDELQGGGTLMFKYYHEQVKRELLKVFTCKHVLDLGDGTYINGVDQMPESTVQHLGDASDEKYGLVVAFESLGPYFDSLGAPGGDNLGKLFRRLSEIVLPDGCIVIYDIDGDRVSVKLDAIRKRLGLEPDDQIEWTRNDIDGEELFMIQQLTQFTKPSKPPANNKVSVRIRDVETEDEQNLVYFKFLHNHAEKFGFRLIQYAFLDGSAMENAAADAPKRRGRTTAMTLDLRALKLYSGLSVPCKNLSEVYRVSILQRQ